MEKERFNPDRTYKTIFPWWEVFERMDYKIEGKMNHKSCPKCNLPSEELIWIDFSSPKEAWRSLSGNQGPLSICPKCKIQVEFRLSWVSFM